MPLALWSHDITNNSLFPKLRPSCLSSVNLIMISANSSFLLVDSLFKFFELNNSKFRFGSRKTSLGEPGTKVTSNYSCHRGTQHIQDFCNLVKKKVYNKLFEHVLKWRHGSLCMYIQSKNRKNSSSMPSWKLYMHLILWNQPHFILFWYMMSDVFHKVSNVPKCLWHLATSLRKLVHLAWFCGIPITRYQVRHQINQSLYSVLLSFT